MVVGIERGNHDMNETNVARLFIDREACNQMPTCMANVAQIHLADCFDWLRGCPPQSIHAVCTDPPYGLVEFSAKQLSKLRSGVIASRFKS